MSGTGIVERLKITDVGCNLKQFDGLTGLILTPVFYDRSTPLNTLNIWKLSVTSEANSIQLFLSARAYKMQEERAIHSSAAYNSQNSKFSKRIYMDNRNDHSGSFKL